MGIVCFLSLSIPLLLYQSICLYFACLSVFPVDLSCPSDLTDLIFGGDLATTSVSSQAQKNLILMQGYRFLRNKYVGANIDALLLITFMYVQFTFSHHVECMGKTRIGLSNENTGN